MVIMDRWRGGNDNYEDFSAGRIPYSVAPAKALPESLGVPENSLSGQKEYFLNKKAQSPVQIIMVSSSDIE